MILLEEVTSIPSFSNQLENKVLYSHHSDDISIAYQSTFTLKYVTDGQKQYTVDNQRFNVQKNQYLILNDSQICTEAKKGTKGLSLFLSTKLLGEISDFYLGRNSSIQFFEAVNRCANPTVRALLDKMVHLYEHDQVQLSQQKDDLFMSVSEQIFHEQVWADNGFKRLNIVRHDTKRALYQAILATK